MTNEFAVDTEASRLIARRLEDVADSVSLSVERIPTECRGGDVEHLLWGIVGDVTVACAVLQDNTIRGASALRGIADDVEYEESEFEAEFKSLTESLES